MATALYAKVTVKHKYLFAIAYILRWEWLKGKSVKVELCHYRKALEQEAAIRASGYRG